MTGSPSDADMKKAADLIRGAERLVVFTGAGMSADSGIATFRKSSNSIWSGITGTVALGMFGTPLGWKMMPGIAWSSYLKHFYDPIAKAEPHPGHYALARLEKERFGPNMGVVTMNVDGLHSRAGNTNVAEVHGTVRRNRCVAHGVLDNLPTDTEALAKVRCPQCHRTPRPDVVLFYEPLPESEWIKADGVSRRLRPARDVMLIVGTTGIVYPAASIPEDAIRRGITTIEVNLEPSPISSQVDLFLQGTAKDVLVKLVDAVLSKDDNGGMQS